MEAKMAEITIEKPANGNKALTGVEASIYELQATAKLAIEACENLQNNIKALDEQMARMDRNFKSYKGGLSHLDRKFRRQKELTQKLHDIMDGGRA